MSTEGHDFPTAPAGSAYAKVFAGLAKAGSSYAGYTRKGGLFTCPVHEDTNASLEVDEGRKGVPLLSCPPCEGSLGSHEAYMDELRFAGVHVGGAPLGAGRSVDWGQVAAPSRGGGGGGGGGRSGPPLYLTHERSAVYTYCFADGTENFRVERWDPKVGADPKVKKTFIPKHFTSTVDGGSGELETGLAGVERTPYRLEKFEAWAGKQVILVEGEKCADALRKAKRRATTFHGGSKQEPAPDWVSRYGFDRFESVALWPDADVPGREWMRRRAADLRKAGVKVVWIGVDGLSDGEDAADVIEAGRLGEVRRMPEPEPKPEPALRPAAPTKAGGKPIVPVEGGEDGSAAPVEPYPVCAGVTPYLFADEMIARHFVLDGVLTLRFHHDGDFWSWDRAASRYVRLSHAEMGALIARLLDGASETTADGETRPVALKPRLVGELVAALGHRTLTSRWGGGAMLPASGGVPFLNGWLDVKNGVLLPVGPERDVRWNVPLPYQSNGGPTPEWEKFLSSVGWGKGTEEYRLLRQWFGYLLSGDTSQQKALVLVGPTRSGKTTIQHVAEAMLGDGAVGTELETLGDKNGLENVIGKGLVTVGDVRFTSKTDKGLVSRLLSIIGGDTVTVNPKYKALVSAKIDARLMMGTNEMPVFTEASDALARRLIFLQTTVSFLGKEDFGLLERLLAELPGIVTWALKGYADLSGLGHFSQTTTGQAAQEQLVLDASPVRAFVESECVLDPDTSTAKSDLYQEYVLWCGANGIKYPVQLSRFVSQLNTALPGRLRAARLRNGDSREQVLLGIKIRK